MGKFEFDMADDISVIVQKDRGQKPVVRAINFHNPSKITTVTRTNKEGKKEYVECPFPVKDYNKGMGQDLEDGG